MGAQGAFRAWGIRSQGCLMVIVAFCRPEVFGRPGASFEVLT